MTQLLSDRLVLAQVVPVVVDRPLEPVPHRRRRWLAASHGAVSRSAVVTLASHSSAAAVISRHAASTSSRSGWLGRSADGEPVRDVGARRPVLRDGHEVPLLLPGEVADVPGDAVHRPETDLRVVRGDAAHAG